MALGTKGRVKGSNKTPVHGAVDKALKRLGIDVPASRDSKPKSKSVNRRAQVKQNKANYAADVEKAAKAGWYKVNGKWTKTKPSKFPSTKGMAAKGVAQILAGAKKASTQAAKTKKRKTKKSKK